MAFAPVISRSATGSRSVTCSAFFKKQVYYLIWRTCAVSFHVARDESFYDWGFEKALAQAKTNIPGKGKGKVISNKGDGVAAQQFQVRLGKNTTVPLTLGFTKSNELFVGRIAMLGFAAACIGEVVTGQGILSQLNFETGVSITDLDGIVAGIIGFNLLAALLPASGKLVLPEEEVADNRPKGSLQDPTISLLQPKKFFGISGFGFTKDNELFVGRMAQLGFAAALLGEALTGLGPLGQLGLETGIPLNEAEPLLLFSIVFTLFAAINEGTGKFVEE